jgi:hypothetical protein
MGAGGVPNRTIVRIDGRHGDLPTSGAKPNSRYDLYVNGSLVQRRWFDENGNVTRNRDFSHQNAHNNHEFPHDHEWSWNEGFPNRIKDNLSPDYETYY